MALVTHIVDRQRHVIGKRTLHAGVVEHEIRSAAGEMWVRIRHARRREVFYSSGVDIVPRVEDLRGGARRGRGGIRERQGSIRLSDGLEVRTVVEIEGRTCPTALRDFCRSCGRCIEAELAGSIECATTTTDTTALREDASSADAEDGFGVGLVSDTN